MENVNPAEAEESPPPVLAYDGHTAAKDPRARWILPGYCIGIFLSGVFYMLIALAIGPFRLATGTVVLINCVALPLGFAMVIMLPAMLALGVSLWVRQKWFKEVRFARPRTAIISGLVCGLYPWSIFQSLEISFDGIGYLALGGLAYFIIFSAASGVWLCYRSHVRD